MSRSAFSKAYEEIANFESMEMTFTIEDADLDKLHDVLKDINVRECPWFEVQDKHGNKAKYYREPQWIPCSERLPEKLGEYLVTVKTVGWNQKETTEIDIAYWDDLEGFHKAEKVIAWMPLPEPWKGDER